MHHLIEQCNKIELKNPSKWTVQGYSKAGERTAFLVHPLKITLDAGMTTLTNPIASVITHSHCDHTLALPTMYSHRKNHRNTKGQERLCGRPVYMPEACVAPIQKLMEAVIMLSDNDPNVPRIDRSQKENIWTRQGYHPIVVKAHDHVPLYGISNVYLEILPAYHGTETVGYGFYSRKRKLKQDWLGAPSRDIINAKQNQIDIYDEIKVYELVYFCDSTINNLLLHEEWKKYPVVFCECTGFPEFHRIDAKVNHTHLSQLEPIIHTHPDKQWILIHSSSSVPTNVLLEHQTRLRNEKIDITFV